MRPRLHAIGIDPGLVHTGLVRFVFDDAHKTVTTDHAVVQGIDADAVEEWVNLPGEPDLVFIEKYQPRSNYGTDEGMVQGERDLMRRLRGAQTLRNTGVKNIVTPELMVLLDVWKFSTRTHHADLRSAARIGLLGLMKHDLGNEYLSDIVLAHLNDKEWKAR